MLKSSVWDHRVDLAWIREHWSLQKLHWVLFSNHFILLLNVEKNENSLRCQTKNWIKIWLSPRKRLVSSSNFEPRSTIWVDLFGSLILNDDGYRLRLWRHRREYNFNRRLLWSPSSYGWCILWFFWERENGIFEKMPWWTRSQEFWNGSNNDDGFLQKGEYFLCRTDLKIINTKLRFQFLFWDSIKVICVTYLNRLLGDRNAEQNIDSSDFEMRPLRVVLEYIKTTISEK